MDGWYINELRSKVEGKSMEGVFLSLSLSLPLSLSLRGLSKISLGYARPLKLKKRLVSHGN